MFPKDRRVEASTAHLQQVATRAQGTMDDGRRTTTIQLDDVIFPTHFGRDEAGKVEVDVFVRRGSRSLPSLG